MNEKFEISKLSEVDLLDDNDEFVLLDKSITKAPDATKDGRVSKITFSTLKKLLTNDINISRFPKKVCDFEKEKKTIVNQKGQKGEPGVQTITQINSNHDISNELHEISKKYYENVPIIKGDVGLKGEKGNVGNKGSTGKTGLTGIPGLKGDAGERGVKGVPGAKGVAGIRGADGLVGLPGNKGEKGNTGFRGEIGPRGSVGPKGNTGLKGQTGCSGQHGRKGEPGNHGIKGDKGLTGQKGSKGEIINANSDSMSTWTSFVNFTWSTKNIQLIENLSIESNTWNFVNHLEKNIWTGYTTLITEYYIETLTDCEWSLIFSDDIKSENPSMIYLGPYKSKVSTNYISQIMIPCNVDGTFYFSLTTNSDLNNSIKFNHLRLHSWV